MNKKIYINPDFEFVSFNFESVASGATPTPLIDPNQAINGITLSGDFDIAMPTLEPDKYDGVKYYGLDFTEQEFK